MLKIIGAVLLVICGMLVGMAFSSANKRHLKTVGRLVNMFYDIRQQLKFNSATFEELLEHIRNSADTKELEFIKGDFGTDIRKGIMERIRQNNDRLYEDEMIRLESFFETLGSTDLEGQLAKADICCEYFQRDEQELREQSAKKCRLYNALGIIGGALAAVVML
ncbi:MAG: stage III sporulation protein AB [Oscillospiraceae bacterium]